MRIIIALMFSFFLFNSYGQISFSIGPYKTNPAKSLGVIIGHQGFKHNIEEVGIGFSFTESKIRVLNQNNKFSLFNYTKPFYGMSGSMLYDFKNEQFYGEKISAWFQFIICFGLE